MGGRNPRGYTDFGAPTVNNRSVEWQHPLGDVVSALACAGLRLDFLHEHDMTMFQRFTALRRDRDGYHRFGPDRPRLPNGTVTECSIHLLPKGDAPAAIVFDGEGGGTEQVVWRASAAGGK